MSLEEAIAGLAKQVALNNELLQKNLDARASIVQKAEKIAEKVKPAKAAKEAPKAKKAEKSESKEISVQELQKAFGAFMNVESVKLANKRREFVEAMLDEFGASTVKEITPDQRAQALKWLEMKENGEKVNFSAEDEAPAKSTKKRPVEDDEDEKPVKKAKKRIIKDDDEDDDDEDDDEDDEEDDE